MFCSTLSSIVVQTAITFLLLIERDAQSITLLEAFVSLCLDQIIHLSHNILTVILVSLQGLEFSVALVCTKYPMHYHHSSKDFSGVSHLWGNSFVLCLVLLLRFSVSPVGSCRFCIKHGVEVSHHEQDLWSEKKIYGVKDRVWEEIWLITTISKELQEGRQFSPVHVSESWWVITWLWVKQPKMIVMKISTATKQSCTEHKLRHNNPGIWLHILELH